MSRDAKVAYLFTCFVAVSLCIVLCLIMEKI